MGSCLLEYKNEKEIKKCIIKINNKRINFSYYHKFNKTGKYIIKYSFRKKLIKINHIFYGCNSLKKIDLSNFNTQNVRNMSYMFYGCNSLKILIYLILILKMLMKWVICYMDVNL